MVVLLTLPEAGSISFLPRNFELKLKLISLSLICQIFFYVLVVSIYDFLLGHKNKTNEILTN